MTSLEIFNKKLEKVLAERIDYEDPNAIERVRDCGRISHFRREEEDQQIIEDWKYVSVVLDRIFLITFTVVCLLGCVLIIFRAPTIYDRTPALGDPKK
ncbi:hypothetical protein niasHT_021216 [Heterodera trifolii]|uniref:Neurotransmitter-gated ion-channel transmembrane domain-containing protein n=1 Tax=Heterodera trifolii TaxID=157864 RepID=A0ABD2JWJ2_9BILA